MLEISVYEISTCGKVIVGLKEKEETGTICGVPSIALMGEANAKRDTALGCRRVCVCARCGHIEFGVNLLLLL